MKGLLTPNQEAIGLLAGFASDSVQMEGDVVQHLPTIKGNQTIGENLQELPWLLQVLERKRLMAEPSDLRKLKLPRKNLKSIL